MIALLLLTLLGRDPLPAPPPDPGLVQEARADVRLVVLISVDQLVPQQLERLDTLFRGGYRRLLDRGSVHLGAMLGHGASETGPGHAALGTGVHPSRSGIVGNDWIAPDGTGAYCVGDPDVVLVTAHGRAEAPGSSSPRTLLVDGFADHLRAASPGSKSVGISFKDRAAILSTGHRADLALWWSPADLGFVSSTWYGQELPGWVSAFDREWPLVLMDDDELYDGERFTWRSSLPADLDGTSTASDERHGESTQFGDASFPHPGPAVSAPPEDAQLAALSRWVYLTSYADRLVIGLAERAIEALDLGADEHPDYLFLGLSACDAVGHSFGPYSHEVTDVMLRDDVWLGELFELLDDEVGEGRWILGLSSDHGVLPLPEHLEAQGQDAGRVNGAELSGAVRALSSALADTFGRDLVLAASGGAIRLDAAAMAAADLDPAEVRAFAAEALLDECPAIAHVYTREELEAEGGDELVRAMRNSYHPERSPDLEIVLHEGLLPYPVGTSHGTPYLYDRAVPIVFFGPGFSAATTREACQTVDVLPTLFSAAGLPVPEGLDGVVLR